MYQWFSHGFLRTVAHIYHKQRSVSQTPFLSISDAVFRATQVPVFPIFINYFILSRHAVVQLVEALRCKPESQGFDSRRCL
jgi:hypothetical protein